MVLCPWLCTIFEERDQLPKNCDYDGMMINVYDVHKSSPGQQSVCVVFAATDKTDVVFATTGDPVVVLSGGRFSSLRRGVVLLALMYNR